MTVGTAETVIFIPTRFLKFFKGIPVNIHLLPSENLGFKGNKEIIASANLPILVTGDVSLTLALDYEKSFIYEVRRHKTSFAYDLLNLLPKTQLLEEGITKTPVNLAEYDNDYSTFRKSRKNLSLPQKVGTLIRTLQTQRSRIGLADAKIYCSS